MRTEWQVIGGNTGAARVGRGELLAVLKAGTRMAGGRVWLGTPESDPELAAVLKRSSRQADWEGLQPDGYLLFAVPGSAGAQIVAAGRDARGALYAAFDLAARIREGLPLEPLDVVASPFCRVREVSTAIRDHELLVRMVTRDLPRYRMNSLHLWSVFPEGAREYNYYMGLPIVYRRRPHVRAMREACPYFVKTCREFSALLDAAERAGIDVNITFCVLSHIRIGSTNGTDGRAHGKQALREDFPELPWRSGDDWVELDSDVAGALVYEQLDELFETYPKLGGVLFHPAEMAVCGFGHFGHDRPDDWNARVARRMVAVADEVCRKHNRYLYWDLHGLHPRYFAVVQETLRRGRNPRFAAKNEGTAGEQIFGSAFPSFPAAEWTPTGAPVLLNHDVGFEGMDFPWLPVILTDYIERHVRHAARHGVDLQGAMLYNYCHDFPSYTTLAEINLLTLDALQWDPAADTSPVWDRWLRRVFGPQAGAMAGDVLRRVPGILNDILYVRGKGTLGLQYAFPPFHWAVDTFTEVIEWFQPAGTPVISHFHNLVAGARAVPFRDMVAGKDRAVAAAAACVAEVEERREVLGEGSYRMLCPRFLGLWYLARAARVYVECLWALSNARIRQYDPECPEPEGTFREGLARLRTLAREMAADERMRLLEPRIYSSGSHGSQFDLYADSFVDFLPRRMERFAEEAELFFRGAGDFQYERERLQEKFGANARRAPGEPVPHKPNPWAGMGDALK